MFEVIENFDYLSLRPKAIENVDRNNLHEIWSKVVKRGEIFDKRVSLGNMTEFQISMFWDKKDYLVVAIEKFGCYRFSHVVYPGYLMEKIPMPESDAKNVCDLINAQITDDTEFNDVFGSYESDLTR